jgi:hypothetical protein
MYEWLIVGGLIIWGWLGMRTFDQPDEHDVTWLELFMGGPVVWLCAVIVWIRKAAGLR